MSDSSYDTKPPANLDDVDLMGDFDPAGRPMSQPTVMTHVILRHGLAEIMGRISEKIFSLKSPQYSTVVEIDQELIESVRARFRALSLGRTRLTGCCLSACEQMEAHAAVLLQAREPRQVV